MSALPAQIPVYDRTRAANHTDHGLPAGINVDVLDPDFLPALAAMVIERIEQHGKGARELSSLAHMFPPHGTVKIADVQRKYLEHFPIKLRYIRRQRNNFGNRFV
jgi:hypothetical protein